MTIPKGPKGKPPVHDFVPWAALKRYPYKYLGGSERGIVSDAFFAEGALQSRNWHIYYVWSNLPNKPKPLVLVPVKDVKRFFEQITASVNIRCRFPTSEPGFTTTFHPDDGPLPYYAGVLTASVSMEELESRMASELSSLRYYQRFTSQQMETFYTKVATAWDSGRAKRGKTPVAPKFVIPPTTNVGNSDVPDDSLPGLLEDLHLPINVELTLPNKGDAKRKKKADAREAKATAELQTARNAMDLQWGLNGLEFGCEPPIFISIDVESYEFDHSRITEIGISTHNHDIRHKPLACIPRTTDDFSSRHFRIVENGHLRNGRFVDDEAENFEFGESEWIYQQEAARAISTCFRSPYSLPNAYQPFSYTASGAGGPFPADPSSTLFPGRELIIVGHALSGDLKYLKKLGCNLENLGNVRAFCDTATLWRDAMGETNTASLASVCAAMDIVPWHLHNAGNDAAYTLQVFFEFMVRFA